MYTLTEHRGAVNCVAFHPAYPIMATAGEDMTVKVWDYENGKCERTIKAHVKAVTSLAFTNEKMITGSADSSIKIYDLDTWTLKNTLFAHDDAISSLVAAGDLIVSCSRDTKVKVWDINSGACKLTFTEHSDWVRGVALSDNNALIASCGNEKLLLVWEVESGKIVADLWGHEHVIEKVIFLSSDSVSHLKTLLKDDISEDDILLLTGSRDKTIRLWSVKTKRELYCILAHDNWVKDLSLHPNGRYFASVGDDNSLRIWDLSTFKEVKVIGDDSVPSSVAWCERVGILAVSGSDINLWKCE